MQIAVHKVPPWRRGEEQAQLAVQCGELERQRNRRSCSYAYGTPGGASFHILLIECMSVLGAARWLFLSESGVLNFVAAATQNLSGALVVSSSHNVAAIDAASP